MQPKKVAIRTMVVEKHTTFHRDAVVWECGLCRMLTGGRHSPDFSVRPITQIDGTPDRQG